MLTEEPVPTNSLAPEASKKGTKRRRSTKKDDDLMLPKVSGKGTKRRRSTQMRAAEGDSKAKIRRLLSARSAGEDDAVVPKRKASRSKSTLSTFADASDEESAAPRSKIPRRDTTRSIPPLVSDSIPAPGADTEALIPHSVPGVNHEDADGQYAPPTAKIGTARRDSVVSQGARPSTRGLPLSTILNTIEPPVNRDQFPTVLDEPLRKQRGPSLEHEIITAISQEAVPKSYSDTSFTLNAGGMARKRPSGLTPSE